MKQLLNQFLQEYYPLLLSGVRQSNHWHPMTCASNISNCLIQYNQRMGSIHYTPIDLAETNSNNNFTHINNNNAINTNTMILSLNQTLINYNNSVYSPTEEAFKQTTRWELICTPTSRCTSCNWHPNKYESQYKTSNSRFNTLNLDDLSYSVYNNAGIFVDCTANTPNKMTKSVTGVPTPNVEIHSNNNSVCGRTSTTEIFYYKTRIQAAKQNNPYYSLNIHDYVFDHGIAVNTKLVKDIVVCVSITPILDVSRHIKHHIISMSAISANHL